jgi:peptidoglycan/LPS O-acetylase OafA/YrhL
MKAPDRNVYYPQINLLRGIAAFMVVIYHFTNHVDGAKGYFLDESNIVRQVGYYGHLGVFVFFVISGFVIPLSMFKAQYHIKSFFRYMGRRLVRLEPPYLVSLAMVLSLSLYYHLTQDKVWIWDTERTLSHLLYMAPWTGQEWYDPLYWTLALEFQFYIIIALIFPLLDHANEWIRRTTLLAFCASSALIFDDRFAIHYAPLFGLGIVCYWYLTGKEKGRETLLFALSMLVFAALRFELRMTSSMIPAALCIVYLRYDKPWSNRFGDISYSLYLTHSSLGGHVLALAAVGVSMVWLKYLIIAATAAGALIVAYYFWKWIEKPSIEMSRKIRL